MVPLIRELAAGVEDLLDTSAAKHGMGRGDRRALDAIVRCPGITASELATQLRVTTGAVTGILDRLSEAGFAERQKESDRRQVHVIPTRDGCLVAHETWAPVSAALGQRFAQFSSVEVAIVAAVLRAVTEVVRLEVGRG